MKRIAIMMTLLLAGIVLISVSKTKNIMQTPYREEGEDDLIGQEALKHL